MDLVDVDDSADSLAATNLRPSFSFKALKMDGPTSPKFSVARDAPEGGGDLAASPVEGEVVAAVEACLIDDDAVAEVERPKLQELLEVALRTSISPVGLIA